MNTTIKNLKAFEREGKEPFTHWFNNIKDAQAKAKILIRLERARYHQFGYYRRLGSDFLELKEKFLGGVRIYLGEDGGDLIILLLGGNKSSQKKDIKKALEYWHEYKHTKTKNNQQ